MPHPPPVIPHSLSPYSLGVVCLQVLSACRTSLFESLGSSLPRRHLGLCIMKDIKRLPRNVFNSLRSSVILFDVPRVVEELISNSIEACATKVFIHVNVGGYYIKVEDDGHGITRDELVLLGENLATSEIHLLSDMEALDGSLVCRGEALGSLSDVSLVEVLSKARGKPNSYCKIIKGRKGLFLGINDQRDAVGTTVIVRDLFYNQPVRRKYIQSSPKKVLHSVKKCVLRSALVNPEILFKVVDIESEVELLRTLPSSSPLHLVSNVFGDEVSSSLQEINSSDKEIKISGYISGPTDAFSTKALQYVYINSRFVCKGPIHNLLNSLAASLQSFTENKSHNGKRPRTQTYPAYILNISCPISLYDLTFEPSKTILEFKDWAIVLAFLKQVIWHFWERLLAQPSQGKAFSCNDAETRENEIQIKGTISSSGELAQPSHASQPLLEANLGETSPCSRESSGKVPVTEATDRVLDHKQPQKTDYNSSNISNAIEDGLENASTKLTKWRNHNSQPTDGGMHHNNHDDILNISSGLLHLTGSSLVPDSISRECLGNARVLHQVDKKFIPVMAGETLIIIDQHAADERIRLEELRQKVLSGEGNNVNYLDQEQDLILPEMGFQILHNYADQIQRWGWICNIHIECSDSFEKNMNLMKKKPHAVTLLAVPCILGIDLTDKDLLEYLEQLAETDGSSTLPPAVVRILNFKACRGAIMFGDSLLPSESSLIVEELKETSLCFQCAHGRPTTAPLLNMVSLHEQLALLEMRLGIPENSWHGLRQHRPSIDRARQRLASSKRFQKG
ncbi:hypothetical protein J5N97_024695 [Dioscorea zingiberensis]|uniref:DNA mismatch repair protein MLH3 n=1 Tax=Dioscorea zingiberensis TaxID=325984 RepID=A0A9D5C7M4_9LILI|nr:hypothetical protein J5N97_024695 [Dioscorea zingiberensis]